MVVHHLDCCPMRPFSERLVHGYGSWTARARLVAHCLAVESRDGIVLVDSGLGLADVREPKKRLGAGFLAMASPRLDPALTAVRQLERLGYAAADVRHIVLTHLDVDHAGGLTDFPHAKIHVYESEHRAAMNPQGFMEHERYRSCQWAHGPDWQLHEVDGERFLGLAAVRAIVEPEVLLVPAHGHSRGHAAVAVESGDGWLLHCGDAYFSHLEMDEPRRCPPGLEHFQRLVAVDNPLRLENQARLRELKRSHPEVRMFSAHDFAEFSELR